VKYLEQEGYVNHLEDVIETTGDDSKK